MRFLHQSLPFGRVEVLCDNWDVLGSLSSFPGSGLRAANLLIPHIMLLVLAQGLYLL